MWWHAWLMMMAAAPTPAPARMWWDVRAPVAHKMEGPFAELPAGCAGCRVEPLPLAGARVGILEARMIEGKPGALALRTQGGWFVQPKKHDFMTRPVRAERVGELVMFSMEEAMDVSQQNACSFDRVTLEQRYQVVCAIGGSGVPSCARLANRYAAENDAGRVSYCSGRVPQDRRVTTRVLADRNVVVVGNQVAYEDASVTSTYELNFP